MFLKKRYVVILGLSVVGLLLSLGLTYIHVKVHTDPAYSSMCAIGEQFNCETVATSNYSVFWGVPLSVLGALYYVIFALFAVNGLVSRNTMLPGVGVALALLGDAVSIGLALLSSVVIQAVCLWCTATYVVNGLLLGFTWGPARSAGGVGTAIFRDAQLLVRNPWTYIQASGLLALVLVAGPLGGFPRYWEIASWQSGVHYPHGRDEKGRPWIGSSDPKTVVVEYLDYDCPACRNAHKKLRQRLSRNRDLRIVRSEMPRVSCMGADGDFKGRCLGARAAYCAMLNGRFWEFNDALIVGGEPHLGQDKRTLILDLARRLGFESNAFSACMDDPETAAHVQSLFKAGQKAGVKRTPTYDVNGTLVVGLKNLVEKVDI